MIRFQPWIGPRFESGGILGVRTLVLGESHYGDRDSDHAEITRYVIERWGLRERDRFLTLVAKTILPSVEGYLGDEERAAFFESIAFYNYVQRLVGSKPRQRPSPAMWEEAQGPFLEVLELTRPQAVVVLGKDLWGHLPPSAKMLRMEVPTEWEAEFRRYALVDGSSVLAAMVNHPSSRGYQPSAWQVRVRLLLTLAQSEAVGKSIQDPHILPNENGV